MLVCSFLNHFDLFADGTHNYQPGSNSQSGRAENTADKAPQDRLRDDPKLKEFCRCPTSLCDGSLRKKQSDRVNLASNRLNQILGMESANPASPPGSTAYFQELDRYVNWRTREADFKKSKDEILATLPDPSTLSEPAKARAEA